VIARLEQLRKLIGKLPDDERVIDYLLKGHKTVEGWIEPEILSVVFTIDAIQNKLRFTGGAIEIGVHHGRFFIALANLCDASSDLVAVDVFADQQKNIDRSGRGDEAVFRQNIDLHCNKLNAAIRTVRTDSLDLKIGGGNEVKAGKFRFVSIDGGHTAMHTYNDLLLAEQLVSDGGVVFVDDILHLDWMGVIEGVMRYRLFTPGNLVPFLVAANKMMLCKATHHGTYLEYFAKQFPLEEKKVYRWAGNMIAVGKAPEIVPDPA